MNLSGRFMKSWILKQRKKSGIKIQLQVTKPSLLEFPVMKLLYLALYNIVENAIKYSYDYPVEIILSENKIN
jgi:signal transduction histidine kinase